jgi:hypothetical protein
VGIIRWHYFVGYHLSDVPGMATLADRQKASSQYAAALLVEAPLGYVAGSMDGRLTLVKLGLKAKA